jgi:putative oxidoreductase
MNKDSTTCLTDWAFLVLRLALGFTFMAHGAQKLFPISGGPTVSMMAGMLGKMGLHPPMLWAYLSALAEFGGGFLVVAGLLTRFGAISIVVNMLMAIHLVHFKNGWIGKGGYEYNVVLISIGLALAIAGAARFSIDRLIKWRW